MVALHSAPSPILPIPSHSSPSPSPGHPRTPLLLDLHHHTHHPSTHIIPYHPISTPCPPLPSPPPPGPAHHLGGIPPPDAPRAQRVYEGIWGHMGAWGGMGGIMGDWGGWGVSTPELALALAFWTLSKLL